MTLLEERKYIEYIWDNNIDALMLLKQLRSQFTRYEEILMWLAVNNIRGQSILDFFSESRGEEGLTVLPGVKRILNYIDTDRFNFDPLTVKELKK